MSVVGLDFGNLNAVIAAAGRGGVDVVLNGNSQRLNPCMVGFGDSRSMGDAAQTTATSNFRNTIRGIKHLIGLSFNDPRAQLEMKRHAFKCVPLPNNTIGVEVNFQGSTETVPIEAVAGMMVKHMGSLATSRSSTSVSTMTAVPSGVQMSDPTHPLFPKDWVITIPGYYTDSQRRAFLAGCKIAGVTGIRRLMHEHTATALAYGIFKDLKKEFSGEKPTNVMFLDLGESTYSCSIVSYGQGKLTVRAAKHDPYLGGRDFDLAIASWLQEQFTAKHGSKLSSNPSDNPKVQLKLRNAAEKAKKTLSPYGVKEARISLECLMDDFDFNTKLTAEDYEEMCAPLLDRLASPIELALEEAGLKTAELSSVEIVGGGTRVGCVKRKLADVLGLDQKKGMNSGLSSTMNADEAIARGAALQSAILSPRFKVLPYEIVEKNPYSVRVSWEEGKAEEGVEVDKAEVDGTDRDAVANEVVMFDGTSNFPCVRRVTLRRTGGFEVNASYEGGVAEGFPDGVDAHICKFQIQSPPGSEEEKKVRVNVKMDIHGSVLLSSAQMVEEYFEEEEEEVKKEEGKPEEATKEVATKEEGGDEKTEDKKTEEGDAAKSATEKKKKLRKTNLQFTESRFMTWSNDTIEKAREVEVNMSNIDRIYVETGQMRNDLESYVYDMRDKVSSSSGLGKYASPSEKSTLSSSLGKTEDWLYGDGYDATKSAYAEKLSELQKMGNPLEVRRYEAETRPSVLKTLQHCIEKYQNWLNSSATTDEKYSHLSEEELKKCHEACDATASWMYETMDKVGSLALHDDPAVKVADVKAKSKELVDTVNPIMHKPKPKPKPVEKKEEEKNEKKEDASGGGGDEKKVDESIPMDTDQPAADTTGANGVAEAMQTD